MITKKQGTDEEMEVNNFMVYNCTACGKPIRTAKEAELHPVIATLVCKGCHDRYLMEEFKIMDHLHMDKCLWCFGQNELYGCTNKEMDGKEGNSCTHSICFECRLLNDVHDNWIYKDGVWLCYVCDRTKAKNLRKLARAAINQLRIRDHEIELGKGQNKQVNVIQRAKRRKH